MILNWMLYCVVVTAILVAAGFAFEYALRALRMPTRWVWIAVIALGTTFSAATFVERMAGTARAPQRLTPVSRDGGERPRGSYDATMNDIVGNWRLQRVYTAVSGGRTMPGVDERRMRATNVPLIFACATLALIGLGVLAVAFGRLSGVAYALDHAVVEGVPVLLSRNIGPALLGIVRFRVVLPRWVMELPPSDVRIILKHEQEHALAGDPAVTLLALVLVALQPWNLPMWAALSRLRLATETDCDARVLGPDGDARAYGRVLLKVYARAQWGYLPIPSLVMRKSELEVRVRRMIDNAPRSFSLRTIGAFATAFALILLASGFEISSPRRGALFPSRDEIMADSATPSFMRAPRPRTKLAPALRADWAADTITVREALARRDHELARTQDAVRQLLITQLDSSRRAYSPDTARRIR